MIEEDMLKNYILEDVHNAGKKLAVWTANKDEMLQHVLVYNVDYVITDKVLTAKKVQEEIRNRSDFEVIMDMLSY